MRDTIIQGGLPFGGYMIAIGNGDRDGALLLVTGKEGQRVIVYVEPGDLKELADQALAAYNETKS